MFCFFYYNAIHELLEAELPLLSVIELYSKEEGHPGLQTTEDDAVGTSKSDNNDETES